MYDFLIVGAGLFGSVFAREATDKGYSCIVIDKRTHIAGNCYSKDIDGISVQKYGPHIFHTSSKPIWDYINRFSEFEQYQHNVIANYFDSIYNLPFNLHTFNQMFGTYKKDEILQNIELSRFKGEPTNLEEYALSVVGRDVYQKLIYGYTKKQWGTEPRNLPKSIITRLPLRFTFDNNYYNDTYQGIPKHGYTKLFENLLDGSDVYLECDFFDSKRSTWEKIAKRIVYTGPIDKFYDYCHGKLDYRSLRFEEHKLEQESYQGCSQVNYTDAHTPYTRIIEHKFFRKIPTNHTIITKEFPASYQETEEPYYPINNQENQSIVSKYKSIKNDKYILGGRLAEYKYYDMHQVIGSVLKVTKRIDKCV
jgi:UDP-galactopyranose mutase